MSQYLRSNLLAAPLLVLASVCLANPAGAGRPETSADALLKLLAWHWGAVRDFNTATVARSKSGQEKAVAILTSNAREIARFLSEANPYLPEDSMFGLLAAHGGHHMAQTNQVAVGDFQNEAATWHEMPNHVMEIADGIADALGKQFPDRFLHRS